MGRSAQVLEKIPHPPCPPHAEEVSPRSAILQMGNDRVLDSKRGIQSRVSLLTRTEAPLPLVSRALSLLALPPASPCFTLSYHSVSQAGLPRALAAGSPSLPQSQQPTHGIEVWFSFAFFRRLKHLFICLLAIWICCNLKVHE